MDAQPTFEYKLFDMKKNPLVFITLFFVLGIVLANIFSVFSTTIIIFTSLVLSFLSLTFFSASRSNYKTFFLLFALAGLSSTLFYMNQESDEVLADFHGEDLVLDIDVTKASKKTKFGFYTEAQITQICGKNKNYKLSQKAIVYFDKKTNLDKGKKYQINAKLKSVKKLIEEKNNSYHKFLHQRKIFYTLNLKKVTKTTAIEKSAFITVLRTNIQSKLTEIIDNKRSLALANAVLLGEKSQLDGEMKESFVRSGSAHVLAVSGMHIGVIFLILSQLANLFPKRTFQRKFATILTMILLAVYVLLSGASPSAVRAGIMFELLLFAELLNRKRLILNAIFFTGLLQLAFDPNLLFDVSFQLSFSAVLGIVFINPMFSMIFKPNNKVFKLFYESLTISLSAQIAVLPFSLYYFGAFPVWFWLSSLLTTQLVFVIVFVGFLMLLLTSVPVLNEILATIFSFTANLLVEILSWISNLNFAVLEFKTDLQASLILASVIIAAIAVLHVQYKKFEQRKFLKFV